MSSQSLLWTALAAALLAASGCQSSLAPDARQAGAAPAAAAPDVLPTPRGRGATPAVPASLGQSMSEMNRMLTALKTDAVDPTRSEQALKDLATFERDVAICKLQTPPQVSRMPADAQADALKSFRAMMSGLAKTLLDLEDAVNDKKPDDAKKLIAQLEQIENQGHTEFKVGQE